MLEVQNTTVKNDIIAIQEFDFADDYEIKVALDLINNLDFMQMNKKLISYNGWPTKKVQEAEEKYIKWLAIQKVYGEKLNMAPNDLVDEYWHTHILDTQKYMDDCEKTLGYYLHHYPYFGLTEEEGVEVMEEGFEITQKLFKHHFGHDIIGHTNKCASTSCR